MPIKNMDAIKQKKKRGMRKEKINWALDVFPHLKEVPKMVEFMSKGYHIKMESADEENFLVGADIFAEMRDDGFLPAMIAHRAAVGPVFDWDNYDAWVVGTTRYKVLWDTDGLDDDHPLLEPYTPCDFHKKVDVPNSITTDKVSDWISGHFALSISILERDEIE